MFATEALTWVRQILAEKVMTNQLDKAIDATGRSSVPQVKIATEEQLKEAANNLKNEDQGTEPAAAALSSKDDLKTLPETDAPASSPATLTPDSDKTAK